MTPLNASEVNVAAFVRHLRCGLRGLSYVGLLEPALYANITPGTNFSERTAVNWHLHLFTWGESQRELKSRAKAMNDSPNNYRPIISRPQGVGFHWKTVAEENFERLFRYMIKTPRKAYRIGRTEITDPEGVTDFRFVQSKSKLRPGQQVTLFHQLKKFCLDELLVAGGDGVEIRRRALRRIPTRK